MEAGPSHLQLWSGQPQREDGFSETKRLVSVKARQSSLPLPAGPHLQPPLGPELHIPPSSPPLPLSLDLVMMLFLLSVNVLSSQVYSVIKN